MMRFRVNTIKRLVLHNDVEAYEMEFIVILTFLITKLVRPLFYGFYSLFYYY